MTAKTRTRAGKLVACKCRDFEAHAMVDGSDPDTTQIETTGCERQTNRLFAQGHDAKLVSFLVRAELAGHAIHWGRSTGVLHSGDAVAAAQQISTALAIKTQNALNKAEEKAIARKARQETKTREKAKKVAQAKAPREVPVRISELEAIATKMEAKYPAIPEAPAEQDAWADYDGQQEDSPVELVEETRPEPARIKVGRWFYDALIDPATKVATFKTKLGGTKTAQPGDYTIA